MSRYLECLGHMLREECGAEQPSDGPPFVRGRWAFANDPHDPGGRTMMGILEREYHAWRRRHHQPIRPVEKISDAELVDIYRQQYWLAVRGDELPVGIDLVVFDMGVNCGVGTAIKRLQRVLGVKDDGHMGQVTLTAAADADPERTIRAYSDLRRRYHKALPHFWRFGKGWLTRVDRIERKALAMLRDAAIEAPDGDVPEPPAPPRKADPPPAPSSMAESSTGNAAVAVGSGGVATVGVELGQAAKAARGVEGDVTLANMLIELMSRPTFWLAVGSIAAAAYIWLERRWKLYEEGR